MTKKHDSINSFIRRIKPSNKFIEKCKMNKLFIKYIFCTYHNTYDAQEDVNKYYELGYKIINTYSLNYYKPLVVIYELIDKKKNRK